MCDDEEEEEDDDELLVLMSLSFNSRVRGRPFLTSLPMPKRSASSGSLGSIGALI